jgi:hypothetical protein
LRECAGMLGRIPALTMPVRCALESKPPSSSPEAPLRSTPTSVATRCTACRPSGHSPIAVACTGATGTGAHTEPWLAVRALPCSPFAGLWPASPRPSPLLGPRWWARRPGGDGERGAARPPEAAHGPQTPATARPHPPLSPRLWRRSCRVAPLSHRARAARAGTATAAPWRGPTRCGERPGDSPVGPLGHTGAWRGAARDRPRTPVRRVGQGAASWQAWVPSCSSGHGLMAGMVMGPGEANDCRDYKR